MIAAYCAFPLNASAIQIDNRLLSSDRLPDSRGWRLQPIRCGGVEVTGYREFHGFGGRTRARTWDPMIKSHLLYQLSYAPGTGPEYPWVRTASFSKANPPCPATRQRFSPAPGT
jgi:hypothetical protein